MLHRRCVAGDRAKISARGLIRLRCPLLPIPQRAERNLKPGCKFFLRQTEHPADDFEARRLLHAIHVRVRQRLSIRIGERSRMALRFTHGIEATPVMFGFHSATVTTMRATER
jgi:hypothetical protein